MANLFCETMKQSGKRREGSRQIRIHEKQSHTPAQRLVDRGDLQEAQKSRLRKQLTDTNPFEMRTAIRQLEDRFWQRRADLYRQEGEQEAALALVGDPPLRFEPPTRARKPTTNQVATVS